MQILNVIRKRNPKRSCACGLSIAPYEEGVSPTTGNHIKCDSAEIMDVSAKNMVLGESVGITTASTYPY